MCFVEFCKYSVFKILCQMPLQVRCCPPCGRNALTFSLLATIDPRSSSYFCRKNLSCDNVASRCWNLLQSREQFCLLIFCGTDGHFEMASACNTRKCQSTTYVNYPRHLVTHKRVSTISQNRFTCGNSSYFQNSKESIDVLLTDRRF